MVRQAIPADLAEMAPGPELSVLLAGIDIAALTGSDAVEVFRARARQLSHEQARLLATVVEVGLCDPGADSDEMARLAESAPYAAAAYAGVDRARSGSRVRYCRVSTSSQGPSWAVVTRS